MDSEKNRQHSRELVPFPHHALGYMMGRPIVIRYVKASHIETRPKHTREFNLSRSEWRDGRHVRESNFSTRFAVCPV